MEKKRDTSSGVDRKRSIQFFEIDELFVPLQNVIEQLQKRIEAGSYEYVIGDDASGRIPALIMHGFMKRVVRDTHKQAPKLLFLAGSGKQGADIERKSKQINEYLGSKLFFKDEVGTGSSNGGGENGPVDSGASSRRDENHRVLIVTDTINKGGSLKPLANALKSRGVEFDIATIGYTSVMKYDAAMLKNHFGADVFGGQDITVPSIYKKSDLSGVEKQPGDNFSRRTYDRTFIRLAREDAKIVADQLHDWYRATLAKKNHH